MTTPNQPDMCGIVGLVTGGQCPHLDCLTCALLEALDRLQYRGFDSAGLAAYVGCTGHTPLDATLAKEVGGIEQLRAAIPCALTCSTADEERHRRWVGMAHTRWATNGRATRDNAHPHTSPGFCVVHNGIFTNYVAVRGQLEGHGYTPRGQTDTEVFVWLLQFLYETMPHNGGTFVNLVQCALDRLDGTYAVLVMSREHFPYEMVAAKKGSPLLVGRMPNDAGFMLASDPAALEEAVEVVALEDGHILSMGTDDDASNGADTDAPPRLHVFRGPTLDEWKWHAQPTRPTLPSAVDTIVKSQPHAHHLLREIYEQPHCLRRALLPPHDRDTAPPHPLQCPAWIEARGVHLVACGTSYYSGLAARSCLERFLRVPVSVELASEFLERPMLVHSLVGHVCIFISQSGETADTLEALKQCRAHHVFCIGLVNVPHSTVARTCNSVAWVGAGAEISVASTKAYTSQLMVLLQLACDTARRRADLAAAPAVPSGTDELEEALRALPDQITETLAMVHDPIKRWADRLVRGDVEDMLLIGRGAQAATCAEASLKLKEVSYVHAESIPAGELKHGPLALIDEHTELLVVATCTPGDPRAVRDFALPQLVARGGRPVILGFEEDRTLLQVADRDFIAVPRAHHPDAQGIINIVPLQLLAYEWAVLRGCSVDRPRSLAKSVTVR